MSLFTIELFTIKIFMLYFIVLNVVQKVLNRFEFEVL